MKKVILALMVFTLSISMLACQTENGSTTTPPDNNLEGSLESILESIYQNADVDESFRDFIDEGLYTTEITTDRVGYFLGKEGIEYEEGIASEPVMSTSAYSLCLIRVKDGADIEQIKNDIAENVDPMKWICVGVDPSNIIVDNIGDVVFLLMSDFQTQALYDSFLALAD
ncbi:MAG: hypothetical protein PHH02_06125 [Dehalococcoidales bacterium]|nr:hypothetical protein [Dehalococcoidales bacterium]MDD4323101.1 hypothetical protein [Dehalococcoidales bacterium]MDD4794751.1 hypothetical protein [Dehalococcoidales bacterium]MDD5499184.1 hypothetical protein [Dehalococcoidales bacterium]MDX9803306.1 hypothetical protein [Dehalococcoidales bacterium]